MARTLILRGSKNNLEAEMRLMDAFASAHHEDPGYQVWDIIRPYPSGGFYINSPSGQPRFEGYNFSASITEIQVDVDFLSELSEDQG